MEKGGLREELLRLEGVTPELEARYRVETDAILNRRLTPLLRGMWGVGCLMGIGFFVAFSIVSARVWPVVGFPMMGKLMFSAGALFGLVWAVLAGVILKRGSVNLGLWNSATLRQLQTVHPGVAWFTWAFCVLLMVACQMMANEAADPARGNRMILGGLVGLVMFGLPTLLFGHDTKSELRTRQKFLELELQLSELRELILAQKREDD